ncbi:HesA/MoeB/ThiF family protein [Escherichia coli]|uniref:HesA/MoeB/ThiF family protein n=1 Tax=Escherichia coli TaxID=562 RepID=A0A376UEY1_ECOLX|nr:HesA/MoeB/ThiF family protein [Escherichia coli]
MKNSKGKLGVDCVFSTEALVYPQSDGTVCAMKATAEGPKRMDCASGFGAATMVTATLGLLRFSCAEEDDGESGASGLNNQVGCDANVLSDLVLCLNLLRRSDNRLA